MAVRGPLVISGNVAPLKWRPFSSCFNLGPLLQRCISLLSISYLAYLNLMTSVCAHMCTCLDSPPFEHMQASFLLETHARQQQAPETRTLGGDDIRCLFNHVLWEGLSVIMLSSICFQQSRAGRRGSCFSFITPHFEHSWARNFSSLHEFLTIISFDQ